jgi:hypothetical protein
MTKFHLDGIDYDMEHAFLFRQDLIILRDEALKQTDFDWSVKLSHIIGLYSMLCEYTWGQEWKDYLDNELRHSTDRLGHKAD